MEVTTRVSGSRTPSAPADGARVDGKFLEVDGRRIWIKGVAYGTTGTGVEKGNRYTTLLREYDQATGIKVNGDFFRLRVLESGQTELPEGTQVVFKHFEGTTALVNVSSPETLDSERNTPNTKEF